MQIERIFNLIIVAMAIIYTVAMFNFLMSIEKQNLAKHQLDRQLNSHVTKEENSKKGKIQDSMVLVNTKHALNIAFQSILPSVFNHEKNSIR